MVSKLKIIEALNNKYEKSKLKSLLQNLLFSDVLEELIELLEGEEDMLAIKKWIQSIELINLE